MATDSIQIYLSSKYANKFNDNTNADVDFILPQIEVPSNYSIHLSIQNATIPYSFYNINSNNNTLYCQEIIVDGNGNPTGVINNTYYFTEGNYNAYQLATYLSTLFQGNRMSVTYNSITNKFTFVNTTYNFIFKAQFSTCLELLGLSTDDLYNTSALKSLTTYQINLSPTKFITIQSNLITGSINNSTSELQNVLCCVPVNNIPFSTITYTNHNNFSVNLNTNVLNFLNIKLVDEGGRTINLNQQYFSLTIQLDIINFVE